MRSFEDFPENRLREARYNYATAFLAYYTAWDNGSPTSGVLAYQSAIGLLDNALNLVPGFSEASYLREEIWHRFLIRSKNTDEAREQYQLYLNSDAWAKKQAERMAIDGNICACGIPAAYVHHKTYVNIGKEPMVDLVSLCESCHSSVHEKSSFLMVAFPGIPETENELTDDTPPITPVEPQKKPINPYTEDVPFGN